MTIRPLLASLPLLGVTFACSGSKSTGEVELSVAVDKVPAVMREEVAGDMNPADTVRLRLPGRVFDPPRPARIIPRDSIDRTTLIAASDADFSAFKAEEDAWIVETFATGEQSEIAKFLADSTIRDGSRAMFRGIVRQEVYAVAEFQTDSARYGFVFLRYAPVPRSPVVNVYVREQNQWRRTNAVVRDPTVRFVNVVFRSGIMRATE